MTLSIIILLICLGMIFIILEILVVQGTVLVGVGGLLLIVFAIYSGYQSYANTTGNYLLTGTFVASVFVLWYSFHSRTWKKLMLHTAIEGKVEKLEGDALQTGDEG